MWAVDEDMDELGEWVGWMMGSDSNGEKAVSAVCEGGRG